MFKTGFPFVLATSLAIGGVAAAQQNPPSHGKWILPPGATAPVWLDDAPPAPPVDRAIRISTAVAKRWSLALDGPPVLASAAVPLGDAVLLVNAKPAVTGVLQDELRPHFGPLVGNGVAAGSAVYAVNMGGRQYWCAPHAGFNSLFQRTFTTCFYRTDDSWRTQSAEDVPFVTKIEADGASINDPQVTLQPVDFHQPFQVGYFVRHWRDKEVELERRVVWSGKAYPFGCIFSLPIGATGSAELVAFGAIYDLTPGADRRSTQITGMGPVTNTTQLNREGGGDCPALTTTYTSYGYSGYVRRGGGGGGGGRHR